MTDIEEDIKMLRAKHDQNPLSFGMSNTESFEIWKALVICEAVEAVNKDLQGGESMNIDKYNYRQVDCCENCKHAYIDDTYNLLSCPFDYNMNTYGTIQHGFICDNWEKDENEG